MGRTVGIDLGTTNSVVAVMEGGEPTVIATAEGSRTCPSVVGFKQNGGERLVGVTAKRQSVVNPENTIYSIKRFMGHRLEEVQSELSRVGYKVKAGKNGQAVAYIPALGKDLTPEEVSAMILQKLKADAEAYLGETVDQAVITVPAYFNDAANRHQECGRDRRFEGSSNHQRAYGRFAGLWARQESQRDDPCVRPRWWNV